MRKSLEKSVLTSTGDSEIACFFVLKILLCFWCPLYLIILSHHTGHPPHNLSKSSNKPSKKTHPSQKRLNLNLVPRELDFLYGFNSFWVYFDSFWDYFKFKEMLNFQQFLITLSRCATCSSSEFEKIVMSAKGFHCIYESKWNFFIHKGTPRCGEGSILLVF